jgi:phosphoribosylglycinamide formyltransferase-1
MPTGTAEPALRAHVSKICLALPDVTMNATSQGGHASFAVRGKKFVYYLVNHHGDGRIAINVKTPPGEQSRLVETDPERYFVPAYLGPRGWAGMRLDLPRTHWREVERLCVESYLLLAPKKLAADVAARLG